MIPVEINSFQRFIFIVIRFYDFFPKPVVQDVYFLFDYYFMSIFFVFHIQIVISIPNIGNILEETYGISNHQQAVDKISFIHLSS